MSKLGVFFSDAKKDFEKVGKDFGSIFTKLFGANALAQLETMAEHIFTSGLGQAALADADTLLRQVQNGTISETSAVVSLAKEITTQAKTTGIQLEESLSTFVASAVIAKAQLLIHSPAAPSVPVVPIPDAPAAPAAS